MTKDKKRIVLYAGLALIFTVLCYVACALYHTLYIDGDNYVIAIVTNGLLGNSNYCIFLHPVLCFFIKIISLILPKADAFYIFQRLSVALCIFWLSFLALKSRRKSVFVKVLWHVLLFSAGAVADVFNANFTVPSAFIFMTGTVTLWLSYKANHKKIYLAVAIVCLAFGTMLRIESGLMLTPFLLLEGATLFVEKFRNKAEVKKIILLALIGLFTVGLVAGSHKIVNKLPKYKESVQYNDERSVIGDYPTKGYDKVEKKAKKRGVERYAYEAVDGWFLADTDDINAKSLHNMAVIGQQVEKFSTKKLVKEFKKMTFRDSETTALTNFIVLMLFFIFVLKVPNIRKLSALCALLGGMAILAMNIYLGRAPVRIMVALIIGVLFSFAIDIDRAKKVKDRLIPVFCSVLALYLGYIAYNADKTFHDDKLNLAINAADSSLMQYEEMCQGDKFYLWDAFHTTCMVTFRNAGKLPPKQFLEHNISTGDWTYGQVYFKEHLANIGKPNPLESFLNEDNIYYVSGGIGKLNNYVRGKYGERYTFEVVDHIDDIQIWKMVNDGGADPE